MSKSKYYKETIDWSKVKKGDPIEVCDVRLAYFIKEEANLVFFRASKAQTFIESTQTDLCRPPDKTCIVREIDWSKVQVDTKVILKYEGKKEKAHFSHVDDKGRIHTFNNGKTSWTSNSEGASWLHAHEVELAE